MEFQYAVELPFAIEVLLLARQDMKVADTVLALNRSEEEVMDAVRILGIAVPGEHYEPAPKPTPEERAANLDRMPKKQRDRYEKE